jgi:hypothetical protein
MRRGIVNNLRKAAVFLKTAADPPMCLLVDAVARSNETPSRRFGYFILKSRLVNWFQTRIYFSKHCKPDGWRFFSK